MADIRALHCREIGEGLLKPRLQISMQYPEHNCSLAAVLGIVVMCGYTKPGLDNVGQQRIEVVIENSTFYHSA